MSKTAAALQAKHAEVLRAMERATDRATVDAYVASLLPENNERVAAQIKLETDISAILFSPNGTSIEELILAINEWIDQGRDIEVEYAVVLLKYISDGLLGAIPKNLAVCAGCRIKVACKRCAACTTSYCSRECQVAHWPAHRHNDCRRKNATE
jgi:hypothetical protein